MCTSCEKVYDCFEFCCGDIEDEKTRRRKRHKRNQRRSKRAMLKERQKSGLHVSLAALDGLGDRDGDEQSESLGGVHHGGMHRETTVDVLYSGDDSVSSDDDYGHRGDVELAESMPTVAKFESSNWCEQLLGYPVVFFNVPTLDPSCRRAHHRLKRVETEGNLPGFSVAGLLSRSDDDKTKFTFCLGVKHQFQHMCVKRGRWQKMSPVPIADHTFFSGTLSEAAAAWYISPTPRFAATLNLHKKDVPAAGELPMPS